MKKLASVLIWCTVSLCVCITSKSASSQETKTMMGWDAPPSSEVAWQLMPSPLESVSSPLPGWIRLTASKMPRTAAAFLELDYAHRMAGPVDHKLRAAMHWVSAKHNGALYNQQIAIADAVRAGESSERLASLEDGSWNGWTDAERAALAFALAMTQASDEYNDADFAKLVSFFGPEQAASMVLHLAYFNFQDRWIKALGVVHDDQDPVLPPIQVTFDHSPLFAQASSSSKPAAPKPAPTESPVVDKSVVSKPQGKTWLGYDELQKKLDEQRERKPRLSPPDWSTIAPKLPKGLMDKPSDIVWYQLSFGYAAELAVPFEIYLREAGGEITRNWDRVFGNSVFWMVTNAIKCPYCMGHCEMNWEVAGLNAEEIATRSRSLASGDWSSFSPSEQDALEFARKITRTPQDITAEDCEKLRRGFGDERAFYLALNSSRYNYMTRISNGFQLNLEKENVFWSYYNMPPKK